MPSTRRRQKLPEPKPVFFIDRDLGKNKLPAALREQGHEVKTLFEVYGREAEQGTQDPEWIKDCVANGWVALTRDKLRHPGERELIVAHGAKVFRVAKKARTGPDQIRFVLSNLNRIVQRSRKPGPFIYRIDEKRVTRIWPRPADSL